MSAHRLIPAALLIFILTSCAGSGEYRPLLRAEPAVGSTLTRAPRILRLYYDALPDVTRSSLTLFGPAGEYALRDLHTMASNDLMIEIVDPLPPGEYQVHWTTMIGDDPAVYAGSYGFTVVNP